MAFKLVMFHPSVFSKGRGPSEPLCIRVQFDEESKQTLYLLKRYGITTVIAVPLTPDASNWIEAPNKECEIPDIWINGEGVEETIKTLLARHSTITATEALYVDTSLQRIAAAKRTGVATCGYRNHYNPLAPLPLWPITSVREVAMIAYSNI